MTPLTRSVIDKLKSRRAEAPLDMREAFKSDPGRASRYRIALDDLTMDFSKCAIDETVADLLIDLAKAANIETRRDVRPIARCGSSSARQQKSRFARSPRRPRRCSSRMS